MAPKNYMPEKIDDHDGENNADGEQQVQVEDPSNSQNNAPHGPEPALLPASSQSSEDEREWNSRFDTTANDGGCFWMALDSNGSVTGSSSNDHGPSPQTMQIAQVLRGLIAQREEEDREDARRAAEEAARPKSKAKPAPKARFQNYKKKNRKN